MPDPHGDRPTTAEGLVLLPRGAFLVECSSGETVADDQLSGRVEHIVSGRATSFESASTLIDFMRGVLAPGEANAGPAKVNPARLREVDMKVSSK